MSTGGSPAHAPPANAIKPVTNSIAFSSEEIRRFPPLPESIMSQRRLFQTPSRDNKLGMSEPHHPRYPDPIVHYKGVEAEWDRGDEVIWFPIDNQYQDDKELEQVFNDEDNLAIATFIRDLHVVTSYHLEIMIGRGARFSQLSYKPRYKNLVSQSSFNVGLSQFIGELATIKEALLSALTDCNPVTNDRGQCSTGKRSLDLTKLYPSKFRGFSSSNLISSYIGMSRCLPPHLVELADYCLAEHDTLHPREVIFQTRRDVVVLRQQIGTLEHLLVIDPSVVNAWSAVVMESWRQRGSSIRSCLNVVVCDSITSEEALMQQWMSWIESCDVASSLHKAKLVFIPFLLNDHYNLLVVNLQARRVVRIDTVYRKEHRTTWSDYASLIVGNFCKLMQRWDKSSALSLEDFTFELVNPQWSTSTKDPSSGLTVMHLVGNYEGSLLHISDYKLGKEHIQVRMRISFCAAIAMSRLNLVKTKVFAAAREFNEFRSNHSGKSPEEERRCRRIFDWIPSL